MTTDLETLPCGTVQIKVCEGNQCAYGWVSSYHLVVPKENQLKAMLEREAKAAAT